MPNTEESITIAVTRIKESRKRVARKIRKEIQGDVYEKEIPPGTFKTIDPLVNLSDSNIIPFMPTNKQRDLAKALMTMATGRIISYKKLAEMIGMQQDALYHWFEDPRFVIWIEEIRQRNFSTWKPIVDRMLLKQLQKGKSWAFKLFYQLTGDIGETAEGLAMAKDLQPEAMTVNQQFLMIKTILGSIQSDVLSRPIEENEDDISDVKEVKAEVIPEKTEIPIENR